MSSYLFPVPRVWSVEVRAGTQLKQHSYSRRQDSKDCRRARGKKPKLGMAGHSCNPSFLGSRGRRISPGKRLRVKNKAKT